MPLGNSTSWLLLSTFWQATFVFSSDLCAKFGAPNRRINQTRSSANRQGLLSPVQPPRSSVLPITWLSSLSPMLHRASRIIMDISQHASSVVYASWSCAINRPQHHTLERKFQVHSRICFINRASVAYLDWCNRKDLASF